MPSLIIGVALALGPAIFLYCISVGIFGYNEEKAQSIRTVEAEESESSTLEEVRAVIIGRPERFKHDRMDRHYTYLAVHAASWCYAWCIFAGAPITSNLAALSNGSRMMMAACFLVGSSLALSGAAMGWSVGRFAFAGGVSDNIASARLSDDIRLPYTFAGIAMFMMAVSFTIYASTSFKSTAGSLGGWITLWLAFSSVGLLVVFIRRMRIYSRVRTTIINRTVARIIERGEPDVDN